MTLPKLNADFSLLATLHAGKFTEFDAPAQGARERPPFVTVSRQAGAGGRTFAQALASALSNEEQRSQRSAEDQPPPLPWRAWDGELVEKVASENDLSPDEVAALEDTKHPLIREFIESLIPNLHHDEFKVYRRVSATIRLLAAGGRAVIVGRGGVCVTGELSHGVHIYLVAPLEHRVKHMAELLHVSGDEAAKRVAEMDRSRVAFYRRHWPKHRIEPESFDLTLNAGLLTLDQMVACALPLVRSAASAGRADRSDRSPAPRALEAVGV